MDARQASLSALMLALTGVAAASQPALADRAAQARICRSILPVINPRGARLKVVATASIGPSGAVSISYEATPPATARTTSRKLVCAFTSRRGGGDDLALVSSDGRMFGAPRLTFLKRYYLRSPEAAAADAALELPPPLELQRPYRAP